MRNTRHLNPFCIMTAMAFIMPPEWIESSDVAAPMAEGGCVEPITAECGSTAQNSIVPLTGHNWLRDAA